MTSAWKWDVAAGLPSDTQELPPGPVELHVSFRGVRPKLMKGNWHEYWKPRSMLFSDDEKCRTN
jgi:hypothetical protein